MNSYENDLIRDLLQRYQRSTDPSALMRQQQMDLQQRDFDRMMNVPRPMGEDPTALQAGYRALNQLGTLQGKTAPTDGLDFIAAQPKPQAAPSAPLNTNPQGFQIDPKVLDYLKSQNTLQQGEGIKQRLATHQNMLDANTIDKKTQASKELQQHAMDVKAPYTPTVEQKQQMTTQGLADKRRDKMQFEVDKKFLDRKNDYERTKDERLDSLRDLAVASDLLGINPDLTGVRGNAPAWMRDATDPNFSKVKGAVFRAIKNMFKDILGAQFTEQEGKAVEAAYFNPTGDAEENRKNIMSLMKRIQNTMKLDEDKIKYFVSHNNSLEGYDETPLLQAINDAEKFRADLNSGKRPDAGTKGEDMITTPDGKVWRKRPDGNMQRVK